MRVKVSDLDCSRAYIVRIHDYALYDENSDSVRLYDGEMRLEYDAAGDEWQVVGIRQLSIMDSEDEATSFPYGEWVDVHPSWAMNGIAPEEMVEVIERHKHAA